MIKEKKVIYAVTLCFLAFFALMSTTKPFVFFSLIDYLLFIVVFLTVFLGVVSMIMTIFEDE